MGHLSWAMGKAGPVRVLASAPGVPGQGKLGSDSAFWRQEADGGSLPPSPIWECHFGIQV